MHVDEFVDDYGNENPYARWFFFLRRTSAALQADFEPWISAYRLYCDYKGAKYRGMILGGVRNWLRISTCGEIQRRKRDAVTEHLCERRKGTTVDDCLVCVSNESSYYFKEYNNANRRVLLMIDDVHAVKTENNILRVENETLKAKLKERQ